MSKKSSYYPSSRYGYSDYSGSNLGVGWDFAERPFRELRKVFHNTLALISLRRWMFFLPFCLFTSVSLIVSLFYPRAYSASARFERRDDPVYINLPKNLGTPPFTHIRQTLERDIIAPDYMEEVAIRLGTADRLERDAEGNLTEASIARCRALGQAYAPYISVATRERTEHLDLVEVRYNGPDPDLGVRLVDEVKNVYIDRTKDRIVEFLAKLRDWHVERLNEFEEQLRQFQERLTKLQMQYPYVNPDKPNAVEERIQHAKEEIEELKRDQDRFQNNLKHRQLQLNHFQLTFQEHGMTDRGSTGSGEPSSRALLGPEARDILSRMDVLHAEIEERRVVRGMKDTHPDMQHKLKQLDLLKTQFARQQSEDLERLRKETPDAGAGRTVHLPIMALEIEQVKFDIKELQEQIRHGESQIENRRQDLDKLNECFANIFAINEELRSAQTDVDTARNMCGEYRKSLERIEPLLKANETDSAVQFNEVQPAIGSHKPVAPKSRNILIIALILGVAAGCASVILAEIVDHVFRSSHQASRCLGVTVLESIDLIITSADRRRNVLKTILIHPLVVVVALSTVSVSAAAAYLSLENPSKYACFKEMPVNTLEKLSNLSLSDGASAETPSTTGK